MNMQRKYRHFQLRLQGALCKQHIQLVFIRTFAEQPTETSTQGNNIKVRVGECVWEGGGGDFY